MSSLPPILQGLLQALSEMIFLSFKQLLQTLFSPPPAENGLVLLPGQAVPAFPEVPREADLAEAEAEAGNENSFFDKALFTSGRRS